MRAIILLLAAALCCGNVHAQVPRKINYQGYLTNPVGTPVNATVSMALKLYNVATGGAALYTETQTVTVINGVFNVVVGSVTALALPFDIPYYLGITINPDPEMTPREELAASPYAIRAASAEALAPTATVPGSQISGALSSATLPAAALTGTITGSQLASGLTLGGTTTGTFSGPITGNVTGNVSGSAANFTGALAGDVTGTQGTTAIAASTVTGKALTGFASGAGAITTTDTVLSALNKLDGNVALKAKLAPCGDNINRFKDCGDGTVTDHKTGLMWEKKLASSNAACLDPTQANRNARCQQNLYTWSAASPFTEPTGTLYSDFLEKLNDMKTPNDGTATPCFAGYCDWRIPILGELRSILPAPYPTCASSPCIDAIFGPTQASYYWSSSSLASNPGLAWGVYFFSGFVDNVFKNFDFPARAVRSGR